ncbi:MAG: MgtC/SapB family protein [Lachnospiraceae bacterium]|nr:MgtC/SapB family protein [Lachnospiraceae bacterium]
MRELENTISFLQTIVWEWGCELQKLLYYLRELNTASLLFRLFLAVLLGGMIGLERGRKRRPAGFRTYLIVCMGATLTMILGQYNHEMMETQWAVWANHIGVRPDVSRFGAQVINGIGFLGAGTVLVTGRQEVKGLTTAAGLWASACMGLAIGAGFYECVLVAFFLIYLSVRLFPKLEFTITERSKNMNLYVEFQSMDHIGSAISVIKSHGIQIVEVDIDRGKKRKGVRPSAVFSIRLNRWIPHEQVLSSISGLEGIWVIDEL